MIIGIVNWIGRPCPVIAEAEAIEGVMDLLEPLDRHEVKELFSKNGLPHDAMWYGSGMQALGPEQANQLNKGAARLMAGIEMGRIAKPMGKPKGHTVRNFDELAEIIETAFRLVQTRFMKFDFRFPEKNLLKGRFHHCFAYAGVKQFDIIETYDCGIVDSVKGWLDALGVAYKTAGFKGCRMHKTGRCEIDFYFDLL